MCGTISWRWLPWVFLSQWGCQPDNQPRQRDKMSNYSFKTQGYSLRMWIAIKSNRLTNIFSINQIISSISWGVLVTLTFRLWSMFWGCRWNFWSISQTPFSGAPGPSQTESKHRNIINKKKQEKWETYTQAGVCVSVTHSAILVLIFLNDVVDCVQEFFYGAGYVSVGNQQ